MLIINARDRKEPKPSAVKPPGPEATIDRQLAHERTQREACDNDLRVWEHKQFSSYFMIWKSCEGDVRKQIERQGLGQIAYTALRELFEVSNNSEPIQTFHSLPFNHLCHIRRQESGSLEDFAQRVRGLAVRSTQNGCGVPEWMVCHFFYIALDSDEGADYALMRAGCLDIEGIITVLHEHWLEEARQ